ncbi:MAG: prephenate dehydrogenase/arogenate dehydrogenase family protein [Chitinispirillales bacterium]|nr:prephenate dehydrogenase/arogenate dehydrogenase family protein [Chitinispirillales bacterium]
MMFKTIAIYGVGLIGGSICAGLKKSGFDGKIIGLSSDNGLKVAKKLGLIDEGYPYGDLPEIIKRIDLLILCSPILAIVDIIEKLGMMELPAGLVITDIGSTKKVIVEAAKEKLPPDVNFIGGHPMAGSEKSGPAASDPYLFQNAVYILTPVRNDDAHIQTVDGLAEFLKKYLSCRTVVMDPEKHDSAVAAISHLPHILAGALVLCAHEHEKRVAGTLELAASGFKDMTRIASAQFDIWNDIFSTNKNAIIPLIDSYMGILGDIKKKLEDDALREVFETAREIRNSIVSEIVTKKENNK